MEKHSKYKGSAPQCSPAVCDDDDEDVFFGLAKSTEKRKAQKFKARRTVLYIPGFRGNLEELDWAVNNSSDGPLIVARQVPDFESLADDHDASVSSHEGNVKFPSEGSDSGVDCSRSEKLDESCNIGEDERTSIGLNTAKASLSISSDLGKCTETSNNASLRSGGDDVDGAIFHSLASCQETDISLKSTEILSVNMINKIANDYPKPSSVIDSVLPPSEVLVNKYSAFSVYKSPSKYSSKPQKPLVPPPNNPNSVFRDLGIQTSMLADGESSHSEILQQKQFFTRVVDDDFKLSPKRKNEKPEFKYLSPHRVTETCSLGPAASDIWRNVVKESDRIMNQPCNNGTQTDIDDFDDSLNQNMKQEIYEVLEAPDACTLAIRNNTGMGNEHSKKDFTITQSPIRNLAAEFSTVSMDTHKSEPLSDSSQLLKFNSFDGTRSESSLKWSAYGDSDVMQDNGQGVDEISSDIASMNICEPFNILHMPPEMLPSLDSLNGSNINRSLPEIVADPQKNSTPQRQHIISSHVETGDGQSGDIERNITMKRGDDNKANKHVCFKDGPDSIINQTVDESKSSTDASEAGSTSTDSDSTLHDAVIRHLSIPFVDNNADVSSLSIPITASEVVDMKSRNNSSVSLVSCITPCNNKDHDGERHITMTRGSDVVSSHNANTRPQSSLSVLKPVVYSKAEADHDIMKMRGDVYFSDNSESSENSDGKNETSTTKASLDSEENQCLSSRQIGANLDESSLRSEDISSSIFSDSTIESAPRYNSDVSDADLEHYYLGLIDTEIKQEINDQANINSIKTSANVVVSHATSVTNSDTTSATSFDKNIMSVEYLKPQDFLKPGSQIASSSSPHVSANRVLGNHGNKNSKICNKNNKSRAITVSDLHKMHASKPFQKFLQEPSRTTTPVKGRCLKTPPAMKNSHIAIHDQCATPSTPQAVMKRSHENTSGHYPTPSTPPPQQKKSKFEVTPKFGRNNKATPIQQSKARTPVGRVIKTPTTQALEKKVYPKSPMPLQAKNTNITQTPTTPCINKPIQQRSKNKSTPIVTPIQRPPPQQCTPLVIDTPIKQTDSSSMKREMTPISHLINTLTGGSKKKKKGCYACENTPVTGDLSAPSGNCELHVKSPVAFPGSPVKTPQKCPCSPAGKVHQSSVGKSPVLGCDFRSTHDLTEKDLDRLTRMHTVCNGTQMVDIMNYTASPMIIKHYPPPKEADKVRWKANNEEINEQRSRSSKSRPILQKKADSHEYPFSNEAPSPIVLSRIRRTNTLARYALTVSDEDNIKHTAM